MAFRVEIARRAFADLDQIAEYIKERGSFGQARKWFAGMMGAIESLQEMPTRRQVADESEDLGQEVRLLLHGRRNRRYKVYYAIDEAAQIIQVFHVWRAALLVAREGFRFQAVLGQNTFLRAVLREPRLTLVETMPVFLGHGLVIDGRIGDRAGDWIERSLSSWTCWRVSLNVNLRNRRLRNGAALIVAKRGRDSNR